MDLNGNKFDLGRDGEEALEELYDKIDELAAVLYVTAPVLLKGGKNRLKDLLYTTLTDSRGWSERDEMAIHLFLTILLGRHAVQDLPIPITISSADLHYLIQLSIVFGRTIGQEEVERESK